MLGWGEDVRVTFHLRVLAGVLATDRNWQCQHPLPVTRSCCCSHSYFVAGVGAVADNRAARVCVVARSICVAVAVYADPRAALLSS